MDWRQKAACRGEGVELWFSKRTSPEGKTAVAAAIAICQRCPVREQCLADCLAVERVRIGIRGGLEPYQREELDA